MKRYSNPLWRFMFCRSAVALLLMCCAARSMAADAPQPAWELRPYDIQLYVAVGGDGGSAAAWQESLGPWLQSRTKAIVGGAWRLQVSAAPVGLRQLMLVDVAMIEADSLPAEARKGDKVVLLAATVRSAGAAVSVREFDVATGLWNTVQRRSAARGAELPQAALGALLAGFAPLARIDSVEGDQVVLRLRAGSIAARDAGQSPLAAGLVFRPVLVSADGAGNPKAQSLEWTWLVPDKTEGARLTCRLTSGLAAPVIPDFHPLRDRLALAMAPTPGAVQLEVVSPGDEGAPQAGLDVLLEHDGAPATFLGRTDDAGRLNIELQEPKLGVLLIKQGSTLVARLPVVPGAEQRLRATVAGQADWLAVERFLSELEDQLIDGTARRQLLMNRVRGQLERGEVDRARQWQPELKALPTAEQLTARLDREEKRLWPQGRPDDGPLVQRFVQLRKLIRQHLDPAPVSELLVEMTE